MDLIALLSVCALPMTGAARSPKDAATVFLVNSLRFMFVKFEMY